MVLTKIDPKVKNLIESITDLDKNKVYLLELSNSIPNDTLSNFAKVIKNCFENAGLKCIITLKGCIENIYELEGGDKIDSRTGTK